VYLKDIEISERVQEIGDEINRKFIDANPVFISVLSGAFIFTSDLVRNLTIPHELFFTKVKSYNGTQPGHSIDFQLGIDCITENRDVLIIEDIVDTGRTVDFIIDHINTTNPASISIASLLWKPNAYKYSRKIDFIGFSIPDVFVIGYGMDYNEYGRNLKDIHILNHK
jgi:hypoxanthine phosphoribosyltransferase